MLCSRQVSSLLLGESLAVSVLLDNVMGTPTSGSFSWTDDAEANRVAILVWTMVGRIIRVNRVRDMMCGICYRMSRSSCTYVSQMQRGDLKRLWLVGIKVCSR